MTSLTSFQNSQKAIKVAEEKLAKKQPPEQLSELQFV
jgi:hypothetical protein